MPQPIYATLDQYKTHVAPEVVTETDEPLVTRRLSRASRLIDSLILGAVYQVNADEKPTEARVADALRDAVCAQAEWFDEIGDDTGAAERFAGGSLGSLTLNGSSRTPDQSRYAPDAVLALQEAGILTAAVFH